MARTSILRSKILAQGGIHFRRASQIKWGPRRASDLWGGLAVVHVGDNGDVSQMFILHIGTSLSLSRKRPENYFTHKVIL